MTDGSTRPVCAACGIRLAGENADAWCPRCAWSAVLTTPAGHRPGLEPVLFQAPGHAVLTELGRGATGIVYRARQDQPAREVAFKLLRPHEAGSTESRTRFRLEAAALSELDHPMILPVFSVGEHDGLPYFTMKLCLGGTLAQRLHRFRGDWRAAALLVATLADGVQYAHSRGVLHRDLKPGNVLFDEGDRPYLSDFGLAKLLRPEVNETVVTRPLVVMGTPGYVAPEVLRAGAGAATTAADVYALGAILHELLAGSPPAGENGGANLPATVPRDLAVICRHSLQVEPAMRYASAIALADDLRAWLEGRPIAARPQSALGHAQAWARRNPLLAGVSLVAASLLVLVALVASGAAWRLRQEQRATTTALTRARDEAAISRAVTHFLRNDLLAQASPDLQPDRNLTLRAVVERAARRMEGRFPGQPLVEAALRETLGATYGALGDYGPMQAQLSRAFALRQQVAGPEDRATLAVASRLAAALRLQGKYPEAERLADRTREVQQRTLGPEHADSLATLAELARIHREQGRLAEAELDFRQVLAGQRRTLGTGQAATLATLRELAFVCVDERKFSEAEAAAREAVATQMRVLGPDHPDTLRSMETLGGVLVWEEKWPEAAPLLSETLARQQRVLGSEHPDTVATMVWLGDLHAGERRYPEAEGYQLPAFQIRERQLGPEHPLTLESRNRVGVLYMLEEKHAEAEAFNERTVELKQRIIGAEHPDTLADRYHLGLAYVNSGKFARAESVLRPLLADEERILGAEHRETINTGKVLAQALARLGRPAEAESLMREALGRSRRSLGPESRRTGELELALAELLAGQDRWAEAEDLLVGAQAWLARVFGLDFPLTLDVADRLHAVQLKAGHLDGLEPAVRTALATRKRLLPDDWRTARVQVQLGEVLTAAHRYAEAEPLLLAAYDRIEAVRGRIPATDSLSTGAAGDALVRLYRSWGRIADAAEWSRKASGAVPSS